MDTVAFGILAQVKRERHQSHDGFLLVSPVFGRNDLRSEMYEVEGHMREADSLKGVRVVEEIKEVALMKLFFDDLGLHARRRGMQPDKHTYEEPRALFMEQATVNDDEKAADGALRQLGEDDGPEGPPRRVD